MVSGDNNAHDAWLLLTQKRGSSNLSREAMTSYGLPSLQRKGHGGSLVEAKLTAVCKSSYHRWHRQVDWILVPLPAESRKPAGSSSDDARLTWRGDLTGRPAGRPSSISDTHELATTTFSR
ncbi:uncharacterized protein LOC104583992 isoform X3 [Brachypodium distachyon]|uniref:uncharacterized protein LOC104583992 isoform X3 n=1 Tax=Brachypodium distachyon TaxID=15368 RepID=UPI000D0DCC37|nr:uncharacterized protein LOC104583992 isoform X3 [Brachypodium distachyon]|eukprot:XP_024316238.1 uncharacterized protein LOC104583992 isoform X3 [Brachypodium distachyon]